MISQDAESLTKFLNLGMNQEAGKAQDSSAAEVCAATAKRALPIQA